MKYKLTLYVKEYAKVGDGYDYVEVTVPFVLDWDGVQNLLGYMLEGADGNSLKFEIKQMPAEVMA